MHFVRGRDRGLDETCRIDVQRARVDVHQHPRRAQVAHHFSGGGEGVCRRDHLVAGADTQRLQRQVQAGGGGVDGDAFDLWFGEELGKCRLEFLRLRAGRNPAGAQRFDDLGDFFLANFRQGEWGGMVEKRLRSFDDHKILGPGGRHGMKGKALIQSDQAGFVPHSQASR